MLEKYEELLSDFIMELLEHCRKKMLEEDEEFAQLYKNRCAVNENLYNIYMQNGAEAIQAFDTFGELNNKIANREGEYLYKQGIKDGVMLMKALKVIDL